MRLATPPSLHTMPMKRQIAAAAKLKSTSTSMKVKKCATSGTRPVIGYKMMPMRIGGMILSGMMSKRTLAVKYVNGE